MFMESLEVCMVRRPSLHLLVRQFWGTVLPSALMDANPMGSGTVSRRVRLGEFFLCLRTEIHLNPLHSANPVGPPYMTGNCLRYIKTC